MRHLTAKDLLLSMNHEVHHSIKKIGNEVFGMQDRLAVIEDHLDEREEHADILAAEVSS